MLKPPTNQTHQPLIEQPRWRSLLASYAVLAGIPIVMWMVGNPPASLVVISGGIGSVLIGNRAVRLVYCFHDCRAITFELGNKAVITVMEHQPNELD